MKQDPGIEWIRAVRSTISHEVHNDPKEFIANANAASTTITMNGDYSITANFAIVFN